MSRPSGAEGDSRPSGAEEDSRPSGAEGGPRPTTSAPLPADVLDRLRRSVPLALTRLGVFKWGLEPIDHARTQTTLLRGLDVADSGEAIVRIGEEWCYVTIADTPLRALGVVVDASGSLCLRLDDGRVVRLDPETLWEEPGQGLRCEVPAQTSARPLAVRFTNAAQMDLAQHLEVDERGGAVLHVGQARHRIRREL